MTTRHSILPAAPAALALVLALAGPAAALEALRPSLAEMSKQIAKLLQGRGETVVAVGAFTGPSRAAASSGPGIKSILIDELQKCGVRVQARANLEIKGDYLDVQDRDSQLLALRLKASVLDRSGDVLVVLDKRINDRTVLAQVLGVNKPDLGAGITPERESAELRQRLDNPAVVVAGVAVQAEQRSRYALEVQVKNGGGFRPRQPVVEDGLAWVPLQSGEVFAVRLVNDSDHEAAVELTVDGLSLFAFSEHRQYRHVIVPRRGSAVIKGWHRTNQTSDEFVITDYAHSAAAQLVANPDQVGTITATFAAAWDPKDGPPRDEQSKFRDPFNPAVGRGQPVQTPYQEVKREFGRVRDIVSVRYKKPGR